MEALGGAASVITVVSLAIQVVEELKKVHDFWQSVKEAPDDIARISTEITLFTTWLTIISNNYQQQNSTPTNPNEVAATDTMRLCLATAKNMNDGVKDLESGLSKGLLSKRWASVKFVFRKDKRHKVMAQLERLKTLLIIVQTCLNGERQEAGFRSLSMSLRPKVSAIQFRSNGQSLNSSTTASGNEYLDTGVLHPTENLADGMDPLSLTAPPQATRRLKYHTTQQGMARAYNLGIALLRFATVEEESILAEESGSQRRTPSRRTRYDLRIAQWLLSRGFSWQSCGMYGSWQYSFRTFRYVHKNSLIVELCRKGDTKNVQRMFDKGLASPFDRVAFGDQDWSLLHFSISKCHAHLCRFLIECGLGHGSASGMSSVPILSIVGGWMRGRTMFETAAHLETMRVMITEGQYDPMEMASDTSIMHYYNGASTVYQWLLDQDEFLIDYQQQDVGFQNIAVALITSQQWNASQCLGAVIAHHIELEDPTGKLFFGGGSSLAHRAVMVLPDLAENIDFPKRIKLLWDAGAEFHTPKPQCKFGTTLDTLFYWIRFHLDHEDRVEHDMYGVVRASVPDPSGMATEYGIEYERLEDTSAVESRLRTPRSQWQTWYSGSDLLMLEVAQRHLDAWMEVLLEAGLDLLDYGRKEDRLHPEGLLANEYGEARVYFEYGDHVNGCRIHVTEFWVLDPHRIDDLDTGEEATFAEHPRIPGTWDFEDE